jgi:hypothetical protein
MNQEEDETAVPAEKLVSIVVPLPAALLAHYGDEDARGFYAGLEKALHHSKKCRSKNELLK